MLGLIKPEGIKAFDALYLYQPRSRSELNTLAGLRLQ